MSEDEWATTCPHHGPSLAIDSAGAWHVVWFTNGKARKGLFYAKSADGGKSFSEPAKFGNDERAPSHAALLAVQGASIAPGRNSTERRPASSRRSRKMAERLGAIRDRRVDDRRLRPSAARRTQGGRLSLVVDA